LTADQYLETATTGLHSQNGTAFVFVTGNTYTYSVYVKPIGDRNFEIGYPPTVLLDVLHVFLCLEVGQFKALMRV
jgi:hypothetical protein